MHNAKTLVGEIGVGLVENLARHGRAVQKQDGIVALAEGVGHDIATFDGDFADFVGFSLVTHVKLLNWSKRVVGAPPTGAIGYLSKGDFLGSPSVEAIGDAVTAGIGECV